MIGYSEVVGDFTPRQLKCYDNKGFFDEEVCYHFQGTTPSGTVVADCPGKCTVWQECVVFFPDRECDGARLRYRQISDGNKKPDEVNTEMIVLLVCAGVVGLGCLCLCCKIANYNYKK